jgi:GxxExxY protein
VKVYYQGVIVGEYFADLLVEGCIIVELKSVEALADEHFARLINYLKATAVEVGLLLNFGPKPQVRRKIFETARQPGQQ